MNAAQQLAAAVLEGESPKEFFKHGLARKPKPMMPPWTTVLRCSGDTAEIMNACLSQLKELDSAKFFDEMEDSDVLNYASGNGAGEDFDPQYYVYEHLFALLQRYCAPFTYFGSYEADGDIGCWPLSEEDMEEQEELGKVTIVSDPAELAAVKHGDFTGIDTQHVLLAWPNGNRELWDSHTRKQVWAY